MVNGFTPAPGDRFSVQTFGSGSGLFAALDGDGPLFTARYNLGDLTLERN